MHCQTYGNKFITREEAHKKKYLERYNSSFTQDKGNK